MASKKIQGITIDIGGNTTKLQDALKGVDKQVYALNGELKDLDKALKLDPKNTDLLAQKQDVLKRNIEETTKKLNTLKEAQKQMGSYSKLTDEQKEYCNFLKNFTLSADNLNKLKLNFQGQANLWMASYARGGDNNCGSCIW